MRETEQISVNTIVRHKRWGSIGTVVRCTGTSLFVAWYGSFVEDELDRTDVALVPHPPAEIAAWRGGVGIAQPSVLDRAI